MRAFRWVLVLLGLLMLSLSTSATTVFPSVGIPPGAMSTEIFLTTPSSGVQFADPGVVPATLPTGYAADNINSTYLLLTGQGLTNAVFVDLRIDGITQVGSVAVGVEGFNWDGAPLTSTLLRAFHRQLLFQDGVLTSAIGGAGICPGYFICDSLTTVDRTPSVPVPVPSALSLIAIGAIGFAAKRRVAARVRHTG